MKFRNNHSKAILRDSLVDIFPEKNRLRSSKRGFFFNPAEFSKHLCEDFQKENNSNPENVKINSFNYRLRLYLLKILTSSLPGGKNNYFLVVSHFFYQSFIRTIHQNLKL
jgi:hypothetical protein